MLTTCNATYLWKSLTLKNSEETIMSFPYRGTGVRSFRPLAISNKYEEVSIDSVDKEVGFVCQCV